LLRQKEVADKLRNIAEESRMHMLLVEERIKMLDVDIVDS